MNKVKDLSENVKEKRDEIIDLCRKLVAIPSVAGEEGECQRFIADRLSRLGLELDLWEPDIVKLKEHPAYSSVELCEDTKLHTYKDRPNVVATLKGKAKGKSLILNGHVDVVPTGPTEMWTHNPWGGEIENGRLYGRGAVDMKGGLAAIMMAVEVLVETDIQLSGDLTIESVVDEEPGGNGTLACLLRGYKADAAIFTEPSQLFGQGAIGIASKGANQYRILVRGRSGHITGGRLSKEYVSAIDEAVKVLQAIKNFNSIRQSESIDLNPPYYSPNLEKGMIGVGKMKCGDWFSMMPNLCEIEGALECYPGEDLENTKKKFQDYIQAFARLDPWMKDNPPEVEFFGLHIVPAKIRPNEPIVLTLSRWIKRISNVDAHVFGFPAGSDQRIFTEYAEIPAVHFGPSGGGIHVADEYVNVGDLVDLTNILANTIADWCL